MKLKYRILLLVVSLILIGSSVRAADNTATTTPSHTQYAQLDSRDDYQRRENRRDRYRLRRRGESEERYRRRRGREQRRRDRFRNRHRQKMDRMRSRNRGRRQRRQDQKENRIRQGQVNSDSMIKRRPILPVTKLNRKMTIPVISAEALGRSLSRYHDRERVCERFLARRQPRNGYIETRRSRWNNRKRYISPRKSYQSDVLKELVSRNFLTRKETVKQPRLSHNPRVNRRARERHVTIYRPTAKGRKSLILSRRKYPVICYGQQKFRKIESISKPYIQPDKKRNDPVGEVSGRYSTGYIYDYSKVTKIRWNCKRNGKNQCTAIRVKYTYRLSDLEPWVSSMGNLRQYGTSRRLFPGMKVASLVPERKAEIEFILTDEGWVNKEFVGVTVIKPRS